MLRGVAATALSDHRPLAIPGAVRHILGQPPPYVHDGCGDVHWNAPRAGGVYVPTGFLSLSCRSVPPPQHHSGIILLLLGQVHVHRNPEHRSCACAPPPCTAVMAVAKSWVTVPLGGGGGGGIPLGVSAPSDPRATSCLSPYGCFSSPVHRLSITGTLTFRHRYINFPSTAVHS